MLLMFLAVLSLKATLCYADSIMVLAAGSSYMNTIGRYVLFQSCAGGHDPSGMNRQVWKQGCGARPVNYTFRPSCATCNARVSSGLLDVQRQRCIKTLMRPRSSVFRCQREYQRPRRPPRS
ncbi:hypothetical protein C8Q78DRAFT_148602 [Trametes maxima]|nr:hypothetical protein C8Q78DRAFT_148602 [Trametes maxima]